MVYLPQFAPSPMRCEQELENQQDIENPCQRYRYKDTYDLGTCDLANPENPSGQHAEVSWKRIFLLPATPIAIPFWLIGCSRVSISDDWNSFPEIFIFT
jgi:hypothetical protein